MIQGDAVMKARFARDAARLFGSRWASTLGLLLTLIASGSAAAQQGTPEQRRACTPGVYRLCRGDPERPGDYRMPAPAEVEFEPGLRGGVRAV